MKTLAFANGDQMPILGLGTWKSQPGEVHAAVREAIRIGYRHIDCAAIYGNETEVGNAIREAIADGEVKREQLWITSKLWNTFHGRGAVEGALRKTLADLQLAYLDLYLIHWPVPLKPGVHFPGSGADIVPPAQAGHADTWAGLEAAQQSGLTRHIGVSNFSVKKLEALLANSKVAPEVDQVELHPLLQQKALVSYCSSHNIVVTAYAPLGSTDRPAQMKGANEPSLLDNPVIGAIAKAHGRTPAQVLLAWHVQRGVSVIPKSITPSRLRENLAAAELALSGSDMQQIAELDRNFRFLDGSIWTKNGSPWSLQDLWDGP